MTAPWPSTATRARPCGRSTGCWASCLASPCSPSGSCPSRTRDPADRPRRPLAHRHRLLPAGDLLPGVAGDRPAAGAPVSGRARAQAVNAYFDDDSMMRRVHRERALALSGPRALLMQAAHPLAVTGLLAHSSALEEPYERLARTARTMHAIGFGSREEADQVTRRVRAMHRRGSGTLPKRGGRYPAGTPYRADDPELLLWILFTLVDSGIVVYRRYVGALSREEEAAYWE